LRARYVDSDAATCAGVRPQYLLPAEWSRARRLVCVRSTSVERTVYTAAGVVVGLFGAAPSEIEISLNGHPRDEFMVLNDAACPRLKQLFAQGMALSTRGRDAAQLATLAAVMRGADWHVPDEQWKLILYRDWYGCRVAAGKAIPPAVHEVAHDLDLATNRQMHAIFEGGAQWTPTPSATRTEALRLVIGRLMSHLLTSMQRPDASLHLYSGHDWSVTPLLMAVVPHGHPTLTHWPPFCSNIAFELWCTREADPTPRATLAHPASGGDPSAQEAGRHVRVVYNGQTVLLTSLRDFTALVRPFCVEDWHAEGCAAAEGEATQLDSASTSSGGTSSGGTSSGGTSSGFNQQK